MLDSNGLPVWIHSTSVTQMQSLSIKTVPATEAKYKMSWLLADGTVITQEQYDLAMANSSSEQPTLVALGHFQYILKSMVHVH